MPLAVAFALAAIVSPTNPVAVSSIAARVPIPKRLLHILEGESLLNDAIGLMCFRFAVAATTTGSFSIGSASLTFLWLAGAGIAVGVIFTLSVSYVQYLLSRQFGEENGSPILISLLMPFGAYMLANRLAASGILAAVAAGITMSYIELSGRALATTRVQRTAVWNMLQLALNGIVFVLLGEQLPISAWRGSGDRAKRAFEPVVAIGLCAGNQRGLDLAAAGVDVGVAVAELVCGAPSGAADRETELATASLAGVRGALTLAGVLSLPLLMSDGSPFPVRDLAIFLATAVVLLSLLMAAIGLPRLLKGLQLSAEPLLQRQEDHARHAAAIDKSQHQLMEKSVAADAEIYSHAAARVIALHQHRLDRDASNKSDAKQLRKADETEIAMRLAALQAERSEIFNRARHSLISDETSRRPVRENTPRRSTPSHGFVRNDIGIDWRRG